MKNKNRQEKDRVFGFLKKYITLSIVSIMLIISFVFFSIYRDLEISRVTGSSISSLLQFGLSCDSLFDSIRKLALQIYNDEDISMLVNEVDQADNNMRSYIRLSNYASRTTNIISIYLYNKYTDCFYSTVSSVPRKSGDDFFDKEAMALIKNIKNVKILYPIPRKIIQAGVPDIPNNTTNSYTFIYCGMPKADPSNFSKAVFINVSEDWVRKSIELWNMNSKGNIYIINKEGILVSSLYKDTMLLNMSKEDFVSKILKSKDKSGYFIDNVSGEKSFVTYVYSSNPEWYFIRVIPYGGIYDNIKRIGLITAILLILNITIGLFLAYVVTGKAKKSIDDIIDGLKKQIVDNRSDLDRLKDEFLYNSLNNNISCSHECLQKDFDKYNIRLSADKELILVLFKIDHYHELCEKFKTYDISILKQAIIKTASQIFSKNYVNETVDMESDHIILAFNNTGLPELIDENSIDSMIKLVQDSAEKNLKTSLSAVLSPSGYTFNDISLLYTEVKYASSYKLFYGHKCIIYSEELKMLSPEEYVFPTEKGKMLLNALMFGKIEHAGDLLDEILETTYNYPSTVLNSLLLRLTSSICGAFECVGNNSKYSIDYNFNSFLAILTKCETVDEIRSRFYDMFSHVLSIVEEKKNSKYDLLVNKVIGIINQDYADEKLCLNSLASDIGLSPGYLGKLFKTYTSNSVSDYINRIRVENASKLLEASSMSISDISSKIGFNNNNYFYTIFRKAFGVTPSEYRKKIKNGYCHPSDS